MGQVELSNDAFSTSIVVNTNDITGEKSDLSTGLANPGNAHSFKINVKNALGSSTIFAELQCRFVVNDGSQDSAAKDTAIVSLVTSGANPRGVRSLAHQSVGGAFLENTAIDLSSESYSEEYPIGGISCNTTGFISYRLKGRTIFTEVSIDSGEVHKLGPIAELKKNADVSGSPTAIGVVVHGF